MSEASKDPKRESLKKRAELLKQELSAAITSRDVTSAVGILKKLQGMPSEFVPADLSSLAEQLKSEISSNSALGSESAAEAARKAKEEEERKEREKAIHDIRSTLSDIDKYYEDKDTKARYELYKNVAAKGENASKEEVEATIVADRQSSTEDDKRLDGFISAKKQTAKLRENAKNPDELRTADELSDDVSRRGSKIYERNQQRIGFYRLPQVRDRVVEGTEITYGQKADSLEARLALRGGVAGRVGLRGQAKESATPKAKQATAEIQTTVTIPISTATSEKIATSLIEGAVRTNNVTPPPTPRRVIRNREKSK